MQLFGGLIRKMGMTICPESNSFPFPCLLRDSYNIATLVGGGRVDLPPGEIPVRGEDRRSAACGMAGAHSRARRQRPEPRLDLHPKTGEASPDLMPADEAGRT